MDFRNPDGIGTHINLPMQYVNNSLWAQSHGTVRMPLTTQSHGMNAMDVKSRIHRIETEAYGAVLRAFIAQADVLTWGKEGLITDLRKELNITDHEHQKLLDESVRMIREWRKGTSHAKESLSSKLNAPGFDPSSVGNAPHKILKTSHAAVSTLQEYFAHGQPTSAAIPYSLPAQWVEELPMYSAGNAGQSMKEVLHNIPAPAVRKRRGLVKSQSNEGFYKADVGNFKKRSDMIEIRATDKLMHEVKKMIYGRENPDPFQVEKAKSILREHERAILEALTKLADVSDGDDSANRLHHHYSHEELLRLGRRMATQ